MEKVERDSVRARRKADKVNCTAENAVKLGALAREPVLQDIDDDFVLGWVCSCGLIQVGLMSRTFPLNPEKTRKSVWTHMWMLWREHIDFSTDGYVVNKCVILDVATSSKEFEQMYARVDDLLYGTREKVPWGTISDNNNSDCEE
jgi:hypothetical protein